MINKIKQEKAITLIALVVTIIVLLILAGISISMLTGENGILNRASEAKESTGVAQTEELVKLSITDALTQGLGSLTDENLKTALNNNIGAGKYEISGNETNGWTVKVNGKEFKIDSKGNISKTPSGGDTGKLPTGTGTTPYLPDEAKFEKVEGTDLSTGLVIEEKATGSQYVWVEVPRTTAVYPKEKLNITEFTDDEYKTIEENLHTYTNVYRNGTGFRDTWYDASKDTNEKNLSDWYQNENDYNISKKKMLKSVYQNGGFWVGRYEAGIEINRKASGTATTIPLSKENLYPYIYVTRTQAKKLAEQVESGSYTSSLMFGVQWDLVLRYIEEKTVEATKENKDKVRTQIEKTLNNDSTTIGNYWKAGRKLVRGQYASMMDLASWKKYNENMDNNVNNGKLVTGDSTIPTLITTGGSEETKLQNIYDIAGNVFEWTLEKTSHTDYPCALRGGSYSSYGSLNPASNRSYNLTSGSSSDVGFRLSLY